MLSHVAIGRVVEHVIAMTGAQQIEKIQPALRRAEAESAESVIVNLRTKAVLRLMPCTGIVHRDIGRCLQPGAQNIPCFGNEIILFVGQQTLQLVFRDRHAPGAQQPDAGRPIAPSASRSS